IHVLNIDKKCLNGVIRHFPTTTEMAARDKLRRFRSPALESTCCKMSLPASLKSLLKLRGPNALPSPGLENIAPTLAVTLKEAATHKAENGWLVAAVSGTFFCSCTRYFLSGRDYCPCGPPVHDSASVGMMWLVERF